MFNMIKISKEAFLFYAGFINVLEELLKLFPSPSVEVRDFAKKVDELLKDIVYNTLIK